MAQRVNIVLEDDIVGGPAEATVQFSFEGVSYEIDLNSENIEQFRSQMAKWTAAGRKVTARRAARKARPAGPTTADIRTWAIDNGYQVSDRGRISADVREAFETAHS